LAVLAMSEQWVYPGAELVRVVDGDTFDAVVSRSLDMGFHVTVTGSSKQRFRLNGCNAAPDSTDSGKGAAARLAELLGRGPFTVVSVRPYKYGDEWMGVVTLADGTDVTATMIAEQWSAAWDGNGKQPLPPWPRTV
jgi:endonuclease YncB( thermonuclease family)